MIPCFSAAIAAAAVVASAAVGMAMFFLAGEAGSIRAVPQDARCFLPIPAGAAEALIFAMTNAWPVLFGLPLAAMVYMLAVWSMKAITADELRSLLHALSAVLQ